MHGAAKIVEARSVRGVEQEHRHQRRDAEGRELDAREQRNVDVDDRFIAGLRREGIGADDRRALEQRVDDDPLGLLGRALDPEVGEQRKLFPLRPARANGEAARERAEDLSLGGRAKVARALKHQEVVERLDGAERRTHAKNEGGT